MSLAAFGFTGRARPVVEIGVGDSRIPSGSSRWDRAHWDRAADAHWAGNDPTWLDRTCDVVSADIVGGHLRVTDRFDVATCTLVVDNSSGWADPAPDPLALLSLRPGRQLRMGIDHVTLGRIWLFWGVIDSLLPNYNPANPDQTQIVAVDMLGDANRAKLLPTLDAPVETGDARIARVLARVPVLASRLQLDATSITVRADDMEGQVADLVHQAAESVGGSIFGAPDGTITFRARDWQTYAPDVPPDAVIGNVAPDDVCPVSWERPFDRADIATRVIVGREDVDSSAPTARMQMDDGPAQTRYGVEPFERTNLLTVTDDDLADIGWRLLTTRGERTAPRIRTVSLNAATADDALDVCTTASPYKPSRYRCRLLLGRGLVFDRQHFVTRYRHTITAEQWLVDLTLDIADTYAAPGGRWEPASGANAGRSRWDRATWAA